MNLVHCVVFAALILFQKSLGLPDSTTYIPLNGTISEENKEIYNNFITLNASSTLQVIFTNIDKHVDFIIFQAHTHVYNITLMNSIETNSKEIVGTDLGVYSLTALIDSFYIVNKNKLNLKVYLSVHAYKFTDPIPGGCNMEFPLPIFPSLQTTYNDAYILVDAAPPFTNGSSCNTENGELTFYRLFLPEGDLTEDTYFDSLSKMMTLGSVLKYGEEIPQTGFMKNVRRTLAAYPGTGSIYVAIAFGETGYSVYVPTHSYACDPLDLDGRCRYLDDSFSQLLSATVLFVGAFFCYFGHESFKTRTFLMVQAPVSLIAFILLSLAFELDRAGNICAALAVGAVFGGLWIWVDKNKTRYHILVAALNVGFLVAAIVYYKIPGGYQIMEMDSTFWIFFLTVVTISALFLSNMMRISLMVATCVLGGYAMVYPLDCYLGSNLKYIVINVVRRATVEGFNTAVISPPFEMCDALLTLLWVTLALTGFLAQHYSITKISPTPTRANTNTVRRSSSLDNRGPRFYGSLSRHSCGSRNGSRPLSRVGSRTNIHLPPDYIHSSLLNGQNDHTPLIDKHIAKHKDESH